MTEEEKNNGVVGNIRIKETKKKKKLDKNGKEKVGLGKQIFVWFMFIAMVAAFVVPLIIQFVQILTSNN